MAILRLFSFQTNFFCNFRGIFTIFAVIVLVVIGLIGWCVWRFMKKKKPKGAEDKKGGEDDENALVDNEEANIEDVSLIKGNHCEILFKNIQNLKK